ncbi:hypothetical protein SAMN04488036_10670 [Shimia haliotis]|uniref:Uncharacterized protein n=2 Tax=Shimia haliotis TaxID=1280847 RepID=A0A1I4FJJ6_9RHOB|nr:hypothetical protein SAMN04488036_10670 [Shimia haliotis]
MLDTFANMESVTHRTSMAASLVVSIIGFSTDVVAVVMKQVTGIINKIAAVIFGELAVKFVFD